MGIYPIEITNNPQTVQKSWLRQDHKCIYCLPKVYNQHQHVPKFKLQIHNEGKQMTWERELSIPSVTVSLSHNFLNEVASHIHWKTETRKHTSRLRKRRHDDMIKFGADSQHQQRSVLSCWQRCQTFLPLCPSGDANNHLHTWSSWEWSPPGSSEIQRLLWQSPSLHLKSAS